MTGWKKAFAITMSALSCFCTFSACGANTKNKESAMTITTPTGEVFLYAFAAQEYLQAEEGANVHDYVSHMQNPQVAIELSWTCAEDYVSWTKVEYATQENYADAITQEVSGNENSVELFNLYKGTTYYVRITAYNQNNKKISQSKSTFTTTSLGPRVMNIPDIHNVRDLGGYQTMNGRKVRQGLLYRGGTLRPADVYKSELTEEGALYMRDVMGIETEIDFRDKKEAGGITESLIPNASLQYFTVSGYADILKYKESLRGIFTTLAREENYPIYMHCTGGADRTGTVAFLINALLGVPERQLIQDYEFTSFSIYGERNTQTGAYAAMFQEFRAMLEGYEGATLQEKTENCLLSIGVTTEEIAKLRAIMLE